MARDNYNYTGVLTSEESKQKNYFIVNKSAKGDYVFTKLAVCIMASVFFLLLIGAIIGTYFLTTHIVEANCTHLNSDIINNSNNNHNGYNNHNDENNQNRILKGSLINPVSSTKMKKIPKNVVVNYRLPTHVKPYHYTLQLMPFIVEDNFTTDGEVLIKFTCLHRSNNITLNVEDILIDEGAVRVNKLDAQQKESTAVEINGHVYDEEAQLYIIHLKEKLTPKTNYTLKIHFQSKLNDLLQGFYRSYYIDNEINEKGWMASTQFSPTDARRAFPCFDEPSFKSKFKISIAHNSSYTTMSNMPLQRTQQITYLDNWVWDHYEETPVMSTYLVAFVVSHLKKSDKVSTVNNVEISYRARKGIINQTDFVSDIAPKLFNYLEKYFDVPFPLRKIDMVAVPDFGYSAMENWGLIIFREAVMLFDLQQSEVSSKLDSAETIGHELGHQWFGNLVTPMWWDDLWLKEGFATFAGYMSVNEVERQWNFMNQFPLNELNQAFSLDEYESSHPISVEVDNPANIREIFDDISYKKGASIIRMMSHFLGEINFRNGLRQYLRKYQYSNAKKDDLWKTLNENVITENVLPKNVTIKKIMDTWTVQPGYPLVTIIRNYENGTATVTQKRFIATVDSSPKKQKSLWYIPITYTTQNNPDYNNTKTKLWLSKEEDKIESLPKDGWMLLNLQTVGFYRVNYDKKNWEFLMEKYLQLPEYTRAQLINDALNIARISELDYPVALSLLQRVSKDFSGFLSWKAAIKELYYLQNMLAFTPSYGDFQVFVLNIIQGAYSQMDFEEKPDDSDIQLMHRAQILGEACKMQYEPCTNKAQYLFRQWMIYYPDPRVVVAPNLRSFVYCTAIREGGHREWNFLFERYIESNIGSDKRTILSALGCSSKHWLLSRYLNLTLGENNLIRKQDGATVFQAVASNMYGAELAVNFLRNNWDKINKYYGEGFRTVSKMVTSIGTFLNEPRQLEEVINFKEKNIDNLYATEKAMDNLIEQVSLNVAWKKNSYDIVANWLKTINSLFGLYV